MTPGEIEIKNSDDILHNIHTYSTANPSINKAQPKFKKTMTEKFEKPEFDQGHLRRPQLDARLGRRDRSPTGVTDGNGVAKIENVPAGKHKVEVWHETLGKQTKEVEVKAGQDDQGQRSSDEEVPGMRGRGPERRPAATPERRSLDWSACSRESVDCDAELVPENIATYGRTSTGSST